MNYEEAICMLEQLYQDMPSWNTDSNYADFDASQAYIKNELEKLLFSLRGSDGNAVRRYLPILAELREEYPLYAEAVDTIKEAWS